MAQNNIEYDFDAVNPTDYRLELKQKIESRLMNFLYQKSKKALMRTGKVVNGNPDKVEQFELPQHFLKLLKTMLNKPIRDIEKQLKQDKIELLTLNIEKSYFKRDKSRDWINFVILKGNYVDKR